METAGASFSVSVASPTAANPVRAVLLTAVLSILDVGANIVLSGILEAIFPPYTPDKNVWLGGLEAALEISLHVLFSNFLLFASRGIFSTGSNLVPFGALVGIFLLGNGLQKLYALQSHILGAVYSRMASKAPKSTPEANE